MPHDSSLLVRHSTVPDMLNKADALLRLAQEHPDDQETLAACCIVILAEVIEQGTLSLLDFTAQSARAEEKDPDASPAGQLKKLSVRSRMMELPHVLSGGLLRLDNSSPHVNALHELISLRNALMHVAERAQFAQDLNPFERRTFELKTAKPEDRALDILSQVNESGKVTFFYVEIEDEDHNLLGTYKVTQPENPWLSVTLDQANKYRAAVEVYYQEVLLSDIEIGTGSIVITA